MKRKFSRNNFSFFCGRVLIGKRDFAINICSCQRKQFARRCLEVEIAHSADKKHICFMKGLKEAGRQQYRNEALLLKFALNPKHFRIESKRRKPTHRKSSQSPLQKSASLCLRGLEI
ncbi:hypothetical protein TRVL_07725 [Trypanosoma vivax]|nr:hypothetical protein TRVL_07725 [Trypanosoma vivax]